MRRDDSLGPCVTACGRSAQYSNTLECAPCYKRRKRRGEPPVVIEGHAAHKYNFTRGPFAPRSDGRLSSASKKLIQLGRESFLRETDHLLEIADVLYRAKQVMESHLDMGLTFEEALDVATLPPKQRGARITQYKNQKARA